MLVYPSGIDLSSRALQHLSSLLAGHRRWIDCRWRRLNYGRQALLVLARLRCGDTYAPRSRFPRRDRDGLLIHTRGRRLPGRSGAHAGTSHDGRAKVGVHDPRRHRAADRPHRRRRRTTRGRRSTRDEHAGPRRSSRPPDMGLGRAARSRARSDRGPDPRPSHRSHRRRHQVLGRQGVSGLRPALELYADPGTPGPCVRPQDVSTNVPPTRPARFQPLPVFHVSPGLLTSHRVVPERTPSREAETQPTPRTEEPCWCQ